MIWSESLEVYAFEISLVKLNELERIYTDFDPFLSRF